MEVQDDLQDKYAAKVESHNSEGMAMREAEDGAYDDLLPRYAKALRAKYARWWKLLYDLDKNKIYNTIEKPLTNSWLRETWAGRRLCIQHSRKENFCFRN